MASRSAQSPRTARSSRTCSATRRCYRSSRPHRPTPRPSSRAFRRGTARGSAEGSSGRITGTGTAASSSTRRGRKPRSDGRPDPSRWTSPPTRQHRQRSGSRRRRIAPRCPRSTHSHRRPNRSASAIATRRRGYERSTGRTRRMRRTRSTWRGDRRDGRRRSGPFSPSSRSCSPWPRPWAPSALHLCVAHVAVPSICQTAASPSGSEVHGFHC